MTNIIALSDSLEGGQTREVVGAAHEGLDNGSYVSPVAAWTCPGRQVEIGARSPAFELEAYSEITGNRPAADTIAELNPMLTGGPTRDAAAPAHDASCSVYGDAYPRTHLLAAVLVLNAAYILIQRRSTAGKLGGWDDRPVTRHHPNCQPGTGVLRTSPGPCTW